MALPYPTVLGLGKGHRVTEGVRKPPHSRRHRRHLTQCTGFVRTRSSERCAALFPVGRTLELPRVSKDRRTLKLVKKRVGRKTEELSRAPASVREAAAEGGAPSPVGVIKPVQK